MLEVNELSYAAIITIELPGMRGSATVTVALRPPDAIEVAPGKVKALRDCTLADLEAFADALEAEIWAQHQATRLSDIATQEEARLKITVLNESGERLALDDADILEHAIVLGDALAMPESAGEDSGEAEVEAKDDTSGQEGVESEAETGEATSQAMPTEPPAQQIATAPPDKETEDDEPTGTSAPEETEAPTVAEGAAEAGVAEELEEGAAEPLEEGEVEPPVAPVDTTEGDEAATPTEAEVAETESADADVAEAEAPAEAIPTPPPGEVRIAGLRRPVGHPTIAAADILINEPAFRDAQAHALSSLNREVAGMLVGPRPEKQPDGRYVVHITDIVIAKHTRMHGASVTYTPESWRYVSDKLNQRYPNEEAIIVGWYHTHPGFGIFLSGMDMFIHQHFFTQKWHVALVLDPLAQKSGFFCWDRRQSEVHRYEFPWPEWAAHSW